MNTTLLENLKVQHFLEHFFMPDEAERLFDSYMMDALSMSELFLYPEFEEVDTKLLCELVDDEELSLENFREELAENF